MQIAWPKKGPGNGNDMAYCTLLQVGLLDKGLQLVYRVTSMTTLNAETRTIDPELLLSVECRVNCKSTLLVSNRCLGFPFDTR